MLAEVAECRYILGQPLWLNLCDAAQVHLVRLEDLLIEDPGRISPL